MLSQEVPLSSPRPRLLQWGAVALGAVPALWIFAVLTPLGQAIEEQLFDRISTGPSPALLPLVGSNAILAVTFLVAVVVLLRRKYRLAFWVLFTVLLTSATAQALKRQLLYRPDYKISYVLPNSFPSGHTSAAAAAAFALILVVPALGRHLAVALGSLWVALVGISTVTHGWHRPADVFGAIFLAAAFALGGVFFAFPGPQFRAAVPRRFLSVLAGLSVAGAAGSVFFTYFDAAEQWWPGLPALSLGLSFWALTTLIGTYLAALEAGWRPAPAPEPGVVARD